MSRWWTPTDSGRRVAAERGDDQNGGAAEIDIVLLHVHRARRLIERRNVDAVQQALVADDRRQHSRRGGWRQDVDAELVVGRGRRVAGQVFGEDADLPISPDRHRGAGAAPGAVGGRHRGAIRGERATGRVRDRRGAEVVGENGDGRIRLRRAGAAREEWRASRWCRTSAGMKTLVSHRDREVRELDGRVQVIRRLARDGLDPGRDRRALHSDDVVAVAGKEADGRAGVGAGGVRDRVAREEAVEEAVDRGEGLRRSRTPMAG